MSWRAIVSISGAGGLLTQAGTLFVALATTIWLGAQKRYHPGDHYMRGPGPKWREKYGACQTRRDSSGSILNGGK